MHELRPFQIEAIEALNETPAHVLCIAPTGSGKSLIYETVAKQDGFRTLLISPLVALARQQAEQLRKNGIVTHLGAGKDSQRPPAGRTGVWIVSPERLLALESSEPPYSALLRWKPNFLVVDECHCMWDWGEDFRPAFNTIPKVFQALRFPRSLWLTATLPPQARASLEDSLRIRLKLIGSFDLPASLHVSVARLPWTERMEISLEWIASQRDPGIVFVNTRANAVQLAALLREHGTASQPYHAGMSQEERITVERQVADGETSAIVATSAFGMGMHFPHLAWALLWQPPSSLLSLAQLIGRVGRGTRPGRALILWDNDDFRLLEWRTGNSVRKRAELEQVREYLEALNCRRSGLRSFFNKNSEIMRHPIPPACDDQTCGRCDRCHVMSTRE